jgi:hypothetical protein
MFQTKIVDKIQNTHFVFSNFFSLSKIVPVYEKNCTAEQSTQDNMAHAHCILDTLAFKHTHSDCVILVAFPQQQWLYKHSSMLRFTYIVCLTMEMVTAELYQEFHVLSGI